MRTTSRWTACRSSAGPAPQPITLRRDRIQRVGHHQRHGGRDDHRDLISGRDNPWAQVFDATRMKPLAGAKRFISENVGTGAELVRYLKGSGASLEDVSAGEAAS